MSWLPPSSMMTTFSTRRLLVVRLPYQLNVARPWCHSVIKSEVFTITKMQVCPCHPLKKRRFRSKKCSMFTVTVLSADSISLFPPSQIMQVRTKYLQATLMKILSASQPWSGVCTTHRWQAETRWSWLISSETDSHTRPIIRYRYLLLKFPKVITVIKMMAAKTLLLLTIPDQCLTS